MSEDTTSTIAGKLLAAPPGLLDPNFSGSVVLLLLHNDEGAFGLVLNDATSIDVAAILPAWSVLAHPVVLQGGPVETGALIALASIAPGTSASEAGCSPVAGGFGLADLRHAPAEQLTGARVFAGYSGWGPGQLESEIEAGGWLIVDAHPDDPFVDAIDALWGRVIRRQHGHRRMYAAFPDDPASN